MDCVADLIAREVVTELKNGSFSLSFVPEHKEFVETELEKLDTLTVTVLDTEVAISRAARTTDWHEPLIQIHVQLHVKDDTISIQRLKRFVEEIATHMSRMAFTLDDGSSVMIMATTYAKHRDFANLWQQRLFWGVINLRYRVRV